MLKKIDFTKALNKVEAAIVKFNAFSRRKQVILASITLGVFAFLFVVVAVVIPSAPISAEDPQYPLSTATESLDELALSDLDDGEDADLDPIQDDIDQLNTQVTRIVAQIQQNNAAVEQQFAELKDAINHQTGPPSLDYTEYNDALDIAKADFDTQIATLSNELQALKQSLNSTESPESTEPPFTVTSIDYWNGYAYATIFMSNREALLGMKESQAGWEVVELNPSLGEVVLKNQNDIFHKIELNS